MSAPITYRGWIVTQGSSPEPAWTASHDGEKASAATFNQLCEEIDAWFEENGPPSLREIIAAEINVGDRYAIADRILAAMGASDKSDRAFVASPSSPQAVSPVPASIPSTLNMCPFCGGDAHIDEHVEHWSVVCGQCQACVGYVETEECAIAKWNRRQCEENSQ